jgi:hypothetical protein
MAVANFSIMYIKQFLPIVLTASHAAEDAREIR